MKRYVSASPPWSGWTVFLMANRAGVVISRDSVVFRFKDCLNANHFGHPAVLI
jgi:hypothetical protein